MKKNKSNNVLVEVIRSLKIPLIILTIYMVSPSDFKAVSTFINELRFNIDELNISEKSVRIKFLHKTEKLKENIKRLQENNITNNAERQNTFKESFDLLKELEKFDLLTEREEIKFKKNYQYSYDTHYSIVKIDKNKLNDFFGTTIISKYSNYILKKDIVAKESMGLVCPLNPKLKTLYKGTHITVADIIESNNEVTLYLTDK